MMETLYWDASYAIAITLMERYPETDLELVSLRMIYDWTISLPTFADDPELANDEILLDIYRIWLEESFE